MVRRRKESSARKDGMVDKPILVMNTDILADSVRISGGKRSRKKEFGRG